MKENRKKSVVSVLSRSGFVCLYFLILFLLITLLIGILLSRSDNRMRTAANLQKSNLYLAEEAAVMQYLRCELLNERMEAGDHSTEAAEFRAEECPEGWRITILSPLEEVLIVTVTSDNRIYDYEVIRNELPA